MATETTHGNKLSALVSILSPDLPSSHRGPAFIPLQLLLSKSLSLSILLRPMVWDHLLGSLSSSTDRIWLFSPSRSIFFSWLPQRTLLGLAPLSSNSLTVFSQLPLLDLPPLEVDVHPAWSSHLFSSLSTLSLLSESGPVTLNTIYVLMTLNFLYLWSLPWIPNSYIQLPTQISDSNTICLK